MKRDFYAHLLQWKKSKNRKPLLLQGARQTGKTFLLKEFGKQEYERAHYFNFEKQPALKELFQRDLRPSRLLKMLSIAAGGEELLPGRHLLIFDEIQFSNEALNSLKYFCEEAGEYHVAAAGSLLGIFLSRPSSFPVGKVNLFSLFPLTFLEFLEAVGESRYRTFLEEISSYAPFPALFHEELTELLRLYYFVGGMPEVVARFAEKRDTRDVRPLQEDILKSYTLDFAKHTPTVDIPKVLMIWESIPSQLARENKKFIFSALRSGARSREYENALQWLMNAGLVHLAYCVSRGERPLKGFSDMKTFKAFLLDVGLLGAVLRLDPKSLLDPAEMFRMHHGAFVENYVAQQLVASLGEPLFYWKNEGKKAEVDFVVELENGIFPLEVKAGVNPKSKSLHSFGAQFHSSRLLSTTLLNLKADGRMINIPLYAVGCLTRILH